MIALFPRVVDGKIFMDNSPDRYHYGDFAANSVLQWKLATQVANLVKPRSA